MDEAIQRAWIEFKRKWDEQFVLPSATMWRTESDIYKQQNEKAMETITSKVTDKTNEIKIVADSNWECQKTPGGFLLIPKVKEKTWEQYIREYIGYILNLTCTNIPARFGISPIEWPSEYKYGLLKFIADDLNGDGKHDHEIRLKTDSYTIEPNDLSTANFVFYLDQFFTKRGAEKAAKIIPPDFIQSFLK